MLTLGDLNKVCLKDEFLLPASKLVIDITSSHAIISFMDDFLGYNQIIIAHEDEKFIAFRTL